MKISPMKMPLVLTTLALAASAATAGTGCCGDAAGKASSPAAKQAQAKKAGIVCPVMKTKIASADKASGKSVYKGKTYYFCCGGCKPQFDKNPAKYVKS